MAGRRGCREVFGRLPGGLNFPPAPQAAPVPAQGPGWDAPMQNLAPVASQGGPFQAPAPALRMARGSSNLAVGSKPALGVATYKASKEPPRQPSALWTLPGRRAQRSRSPNWL